ncbi:hypothetical protein FLAG1_08105 [Fusarium langsethiae]|uniref:Uncharacterized protein n=1 Tax=Fusarium langsethiae TaxID=179993 RepID=A0A0N0DD18_FUSLA|nr:hypothetical protein FLAG1_08105 [Fusarium langsethiae]GKU06415.1 unnamed protein product [Fusarium langsethiae]GKU20954.1 unnamed protein product [Fusarium langsethiae]
MPGRTAPPRESYFRRALYALPFLAITALMTRAFGMAEPIGPVIEEMVKTSVFNGPGVDVPIIKSFYGVPVLDDIFNVVTVAFANLQFYFDEKAYWQSFVFLTDFAGMYAVVQLESYRPGNTFLISKYPVVFLFVSQIIAIGCTAPIFFFLAYVFTPAHKLTTQSLGRLSAGPCKAIFAAIILGYYVPHFPSYFSASLEIRNWWNWIWQLFPVWGCSIMFVLSKVFTRVNKSTGKLNHERDALRILMGACSFISMGAWWYTVASMRNSVFEVFVPQYLINYPLEPSVGLRTVIQFDYICCYAAGYLWLAYHFRDLEKVGVCSISWARAIGVTVVLGFVVGPGTLFPILWLLREELLMAANGEVKEFHD